MGEQTFEDNVMENSTDSSCAFKFRVIMESVEVYPQERSVCLFKALLEVSLSYWWLGSE